MNTYVIEVPGVPMPEGSKRAFLNKRTGKVNIVADNRDALAKYRADITEAWIRDHGGSLKATPHGARVAISFFFRRPASHWGKKGLLPSAPPYKTTKPDLDKLARAALDALTGLAYVDDAQVFDLAIHKSYSESDTAYTIITVIS